MPTDTLPTSDDLVNDASPTAVEEDSSTCVETEVAACPACGSTEPWGQTSWCPDCNYYPAMGGVTVKSEPAEGLSADVEPIDWKTVIPPWAWVLLGGMGVVLGASIFARVVTPVAGPTRLIWSLAQIIAGLVFLGVGQFSAYLFAVSGSDKFGPFDIAMKPIGIWKPALAILPLHAWRVWLAGWGLTAIMGAIVLVGGIRFSAIADDWGFEQPAQKNLVEAIVSEARRQKEAGAESLEEAMNDFAGEGEGEDEAAADEAKLIATDCLIIGYTKEGKNDFSMILLGAFVENKLRFVGSLTVEELSDEAHATLQQRMPQFTQEKPFLKTGYTATWLQPKLMCRVKSDGFTRGKKLKDAVFDSLLVDVKAGQ